MASARPPASPRPPPIATEHQPLRGTLPLSSTSAAFLPVPADFSAVPCKPLLAASGVFLTTWTAGSRSMRCATAATWWTWMVRTLALAFFALIVLIPLLYGDRHRYSGGSVANSITTAFNFAGPLFWLHVSARNGFMFSLAAAVHRLSPQECRAAVRRCERVYFPAAFVPSAAFFGYHIAPLGHSTLARVLYVAMFVVCIAWWALWVAMFAFVCECHRIHATYVAQRVIGGDRPSRDVMMHHQWLKLVLHASQRHLSVPVSLNVLVHVVDMFVFSWAALTAPLYTSAGYGVVQVAGGLVWDGAGLLVLMFPAASVSAACKSTVAAAASRVTRFGSYSAGADVRTESADMHDVEAFALDYVAHPEAPVVVRPESSVFSAAASQEAMPLSPASRLRSSIGYDPHAVAAERSPAFKELSNVELLGFVQAASQTMRFRVGGFAMTKSAAVKVVYTLAAGLFVMLRAVLGRED